MVNHELRELIALAAALGTVEQTDGWQAVAPQVSQMPPACHGHAHCVRNQWGIPEPTWLQRMTAGLPDPGFTHVAPPLHRLQGFTAPQEEQHATWAAAGLVSRSALHLQMKGAGEEEDGGVSLVPSAPPAHVSLTTLLEGEGDLLSLEPPMWVPDSHASACTRCKLPFR